MLRSLRNRRPSHTTVAAYLALFGVLAGGGAYAASKIGSDDIKRNAVLSKHIKKANVKVADVAERAGFRAVAAVNTEENPTFRNSTVQERGFDSVTRAAEGIYCLTPSASAGLNPATDPPLITFEFNYSVGTNFTAMWNSLTSTCATGTYEIRTYQADTSVGTDDPQFVIFVP